MDIIDITDLIDIMDMKERKKRGKREKRREKEREKMSRVNYDQFEFNSQKEKLNILAEMLEISKSGLAAAADVV